MRLGKSAIEPRDRSWSRSHARTLFWQAVAKSAPEVFNDLCTGPFETYHRLFFDFTFKRVPEIWTGRAPLGRDRGGPDISGQDCGVELIPIRDQLVAQGWVPVVSGDFGFAVNVSDDSIEDVSLRSISRLYMTEEAAWLAKLLWDFTRFACGLEPGVRIGQATVAIDLIDEDDLYVLCRDEVELSVELSERVIESLRLGDGFASLVAGLEKLREQVLTWANRYGLSDNWCVGYAILLMNSWAQFPQLRGTLPYTASPAREPTTTACDPAFADLGRIERELRRALKAPGMVPTPKSVSFVHYEWLTQYAVRGLSYTEVQSTFTQRRQHYELKAIQKAVRQSADRIGLTLGERRGAPRKLVHKKSYPHSI